MRTNPIHSAPTSTGVTMIVSAVALCAVAAIEAHAADLKQAQELFQKSHWAEARAAARQAYSSLPSRDRAVARFLIGRSFVREAEICRALRQIADDVGREYLAELGSQKANRSNAYIPLFEGFYALDYGEAGRALSSIDRAGSRVPPKWRALAQLRRAVALKLQGNAQGNRALASDKTIEGLYWRLVLDHQTSAHFTAAKSGNRERLMAACLFYRKGEADEAEKAAAGAELDAPDVEVKPDPKKVLRFFDPLLLAAWERLQWERAVVVLRPLAASGSSTEAVLGAHYAGLALFYLGAWDDAEPLLARSSQYAPSPELKSVARLLAAACQWTSRPPTQNTLNDLWAATSPNAEAVLAWDLVRRAELASREPFASKLDARLATLFNDASAQPSGATVGRWGLLRLARNAESSALVADLSAHRDHSNKNKLEWNDPLLLLALAGANYRNNEYAQALETLFEMAKTLPGLRGLQWNLQGIYAARQKAGGEARISQ